MTKTVEPLEVSDKIESAFDHLQEQLSMLESTSLSQEKLDSRAVFTAIVDAGLAVVDAASGAGGLDISEGHQSQVDTRLKELGLPYPDRFAANINYGQAIPALRLFGTTEQQHRLIAPLWTADLICCQLFSEPEAGSDLANVRASATPVEGGWRVTGHKLWTSLAHKADIAILLARTSTEKLRHRGLSFFFIDMKQEGIRIEPLRQITGEAEFNEVHLEDAFIPESNLIGEIDGGWKVAMGVLEVERAFYEAAQPPRDSGAMGMLSQAWRQARDAGIGPDGLRSEVVSAWIRSEVSRFANRKLAERLATGGDPSEASISKVRFAENLQQIARLNLDLSGPAALQAANYSYSRPDRTEFFTDNPVYTYLRSRATSIEGGTTEIQRNIIADRLLQLPRSKRNEN